MFCLRDPFGTKPFYYYETEDGTLLYGTTIRKIMEQPGFKKELNEEMLQKTDTDYAPWTIVEATDRRFATIKIYTTVINCLSAEIEKRKQENKKKSCRIRCL